MNIVYFAHLQKPSIKPNASIMLTVKLKKKCYMNYSNKFQIYIHETWSLGTPYTAWHFQLSNYSCRCTTPVQVLLLLFSLFVCTSICYRILVLRLAVCQNQLLILPIGNFGKQRLRNNILDRVVLEFSFYKYSGCND